jgi:mannose-6-phosphate isomerase-like protein (cupin superfamily)
MPACISPSSVLPATIAPDGIAIHTFDVPAGAHVGVAEGRIPPGRYGIHRHLSLEQYTYVVSGRVTVITGTAERPQGHAIEAGPGDLVLTLPGESLQFVNDGSEEARVLFICAPPYPADDSDTRTLDAHGAPTASEIEDAVARLEVVRAAFNAAIDQRIRALRT